MIKYTFERRCILLWHQKGKNLKNNGGCNYELYNRLCPCMEKPDSNIVEYAEDVLYLVNLLIDNK